MTSDERRKRAEGVAEELGMTLLERKHRFTLSREVPLSHPIAWKRGGEPGIDRSKLEVGCHERRCVWTEKRDDGWERKREVVIDPSPDYDAHAEVYTVVFTRMTGGGTAHGPHDRYPDGHQVIAEDSKGRELRFYQSGCFTNLVLPAQVTVIRDPESAADNPTDAETDCGAEETR